MKEKQTLEPTVDRGFSYLVGNHYPDSLVGNLLEAIEILGLSETQEQGFKNLVRDLIWKHFQSSNTVMVDEELAHKMAIDWWKKREENPHAFVVVLED